MKGASHLKLEKKKRRLILGIISGLIVLAALGAWGFSRYYVSLLSPVNPKDNHPVILKVNEGSGIGTIGRLLEKKKLIRKAWAFEFYARWNHLNAYRSGTYIFNRSYSVGHLMDDLKKGKNRRIIVVIGVRQGMWVTNVAEQIATATGQSKTKILNQLADKNYVKSHYMSRYPFLTNAILAKGVKYPLEGYLAPGSYSFDKVNNPLTLDQIVDKMLDQTGKELDNLAGPIHRNKLGSVHKVLTLASMIEQEAPNTKDRKRIAGVLENRLKKGMRLQTDPSVAYGEQKQVQEYSHHDFRRAYKVYNPYNTYSRKGLPVGPIGSPALDAIKAVLDPVSSKNFFFYARPNGKVYYSKTYAEHQKIVSKYQQEWAKS